MMTGVLLIFLKRFVSFKKMLLIFLLEPKQYVQKVGTGLSRIIHHFLHINENLCFTGSWKG